MSGAKRTSTHAVSLIMAVILARMHICTTGYLVAAWEAQPCLTACGIPKAALAQTNHVNPSPPGGGHRLRASETLHPGRMGGWEKQKGDAKHSYRCTHSPWPIPLFRYLLFGYTIRQPSVSVLWHDQDPFFFFKERKAT